MNKWDVRRTEKFCQLMTEAQVQGEAITIKTLLVALKTKKQNGMHGVQIFTERYRNS